MSLRFIYVQYPLETLAFVALLYFLISRAMRSRDPRTVLLVLVGLNVLRFGGASLVPWPRARHPMLRPSSPRWRSATV